MMYRIFNSIPFVCLAACGGTSANTVVEVADLPVNTPITFVAGVYDEGFAEVSYAARQDWLDEALAIVDTLDPTDLDTLGPTGSANYDGLIQLDYDAYVDETRRETYRFASATGKVKFTVQFSEVEGGMATDFQGTANSFLLSDGTPLQGGYTLEVRCP